MMRAAATEIAGERLLGLFERRLRRLRQQRRAGHDHAVGAVAALRGLLGNEGGLDGMGLLGGAQALYGGNAMSCSRRNRQAAGAHGAAVDMHGAGAALAKAAAEF